MVRCKTHRYLTHNMSEPQIAAIGSGEERGQDIQLSPSSAGRPDTETPKLAQQTSSASLATIPSIVVAVHVSRGAEVVLLGEGMALVAPSMPKAAARIASVFVCMVMMDDELED